MEQHEMTVDEKLCLHMAAALTLTQEQIDACAWVMGASGCGWTRDDIINELVAARRVEKMLGWDKIKS